MKKRIALAIAVVLILASPLVTSSLTKSRIEEQIDLVKDLPGYNIELVDYKKGYMSSQAKINVGFDISSAQMGGAIPENPDVLELFKKGIVFNIDINHGPVILGSSPSFALSHYTLTFDEEQDFVTAATKALNIDYLFKLQSNISYTGKETGTLDVPAFSLSESEPDGSVNFGGLVIDLESENFGETYSFDGTIEELAVISPIINLTVSPATISGRGKKAEQLMLSPGTFDINFPLITFSGMDKGEVENFYIGGESTLSDNNLMNVYAKYSVDRAQSTMAALNLTDAVFDFGVENLNGDALIELNNSLQDLAQQEQLNQDPSVMFGVLEKFLDDSPKLVIKQLGYSLNGIPNLSLSGELAINSDLLSKPVSLDNPMLLIGAVESQLNASVHKTLVAQLVQMFSMQQSQGMMEQMELTPQQAGEMIQQQTQQIQMMLDQFVQQGFITEEGENLLIDANFKQGALTLNGKPMQM